MNGPGDMDDRSTETTVSPFIVTESLLVCESSWTSVTTASILGIPAVGVIVTVATPPLTVPEMRMGTCSV